MMRGGGGRQEEVKKDRMQVLETESPPWGAVGGGKYRAEGAQAHFEHGLESGKMHPQCTTENVHTLKRRNHNHTLNTS